jgi:small-conductance mechanosensitive channel
MDLPSYIPDAVTWGGILLTVAILIAGWILSRYARRGVTALLGRMRGVTPTFATVAGRVVGYMIVLIAVGVALALMGANIQPLLAVVIVVGVVLVLVLRGVADNFAAGVLIQSRRTVSVGDEIQVEGPDGPVIGRVLELNARAVVILSRDGRTVHVPNAKLLSDSVINDSRHEARRSEVQVRVTRASHTVDTLVEWVRDAVAAVEGVHSREPARVLITEIGPERVILRAQFWHHPLHDAPVTSEVVRAVASALEGRDLACTITSDPGDRPLVPPDRM